MNFIESLAARRRFGMKPGLGAISALCAALGDPQRNFQSVHVAGTNGKGAVCAILDAALRRDAFKVGRYTSPHLVRINERFFLDGAPLSDAALDAAARRVEEASRGRADLAELTFFEALTAVAFLAFSEAKVDFGVLETGLGGRLDATNICRPVLSVITRVGLDHCDWLGDTVEKIAAEKAGIIKKGVPVVLGANTDEARRVVESRAADAGAPFFYAPDLADEGEVPPDFPLKGSFNRENAVTALAALRILRSSGAGLSSLDLSWPGRYQRVGKFLIDGAHNPPAAKALSAALAADGAAPKSLSLVAGFCADKDVAEVLRILAPFVARGFAVRTRNPRSLPSEETAAMMRAAGIPAVPCATLREAMDGADAPVLVAGSLFLAGEALAELGIMGGSAPRFDPSETLALRATGG